jgi:hypothetical protein
VRWQSVAATALSRGLSFQRCFEVLIDFIRRAWLLAVRTMNGLSDSQKARFRKWGLVWISLASIVIGVPMAGTFSVPYF